MIEVNQSIGAPLEVMRQIVEAKGLQHAVLWDEDCVNTRTYGVKAWPCVYLIGVDGTVIWEGNPSRWMRRPIKAAEIRALIERELLKARRQLHVVVDRSMIRAMGLQTFRE